MSLWLTESIKCQNLICFVSLVVFQLDSLLSTSSLSLEPPKPVGKFCSVSDYLDLLARKESITFTGLWCCASNAGSLISAAAFPFFWQVGGWTQVYGDILSFATIRGASHEAPFSQPERALVLFKAFLQGRPLPETFWSWCAENWPFVLINRSVFEKMPMVCLRVVIESFCRVEIKQRRRYHCAGFVRWCENQNVTKKRPKLRLADANFQNQDSLLSQNCLFFSLSL